MDEALRSPLFVKAERQSRFLRFVVEAALQSPAPSVREFDIARQVYDRRADYDPRIDPIVRVEAARLRARLREYYEGAPPARVRIELPKGRYLPRFTFLRQQSAGVRRATTTVLVPPFRTLSPVEDASFTEGLAEECIHRLTHLAGIRVMPAPPPPPPDPPAVRPDLRLDVTVRREGPDVRVILRLVDPTTGVSRASTVHTATVTDVFAAQERLAQAVAADVAAAVQETALPPEID